MSTLTPLPRPDTSLNTAAEASFSSFFEPSPIAVEVKAAEQPATEAESFPADGGIDDERLQAQRWEAIGRLTGGIVHDFNNLLTGVTLYCDLLLSTFDPRDRRKRYADEIRLAIVQATGLVQQLLVFARSQPTPTEPLMLNELAEAMGDLLGRLIGENIALELRLDPGLGAVNLAPSQAQQVLLNLVLNARDALPNGGHITVETTNCSFQPISEEGTTSKAAFPCVLLLVADDGQGMDAATRSRLAEPFFTTKAGKGSGLGLLTVRSIVAANHGLIHFESEPGHGTRAMILFPRVPRTADSDFSGKTPPKLHAISRPLQDAKKESHL
jgi:two-component system cell cycle sensor histidine kinase/response regulator CckA